MQVTSAHDEKIVIDTVGFLPSTARGNKFIVTAVDHFTKMACKSSEFICKFLREQAMPTFPMTKAFLSDNGLEYKATETQNLARSKRVTWKFGSLYHLETQGVIERFNDKFIRKLKKLSNYSHKGRDLKVKMTIEAYNMFFRRAIDCLLFKMFFEKRPILEADRGIIPESFNASIPSKSLAEALFTILCKY